MLTDTKVRNLRSNGKRSKYADGQGHNLEKGTVAGLVEAFMERTGEP